MTALVLAGCRTAPLGSYLGGLGLMRAVTRTLDPDALGHWRAGQFVLTSRFTSEAQLVDELSESFRPEAIVSPWNAGSGFAANGKNTSAEGLLQRVREVTDGRLAPLRAAVVAGDRVVAVGRARGWGGKGDELWEKARKAQVLGLCRNTFPDDALAWVDAAVALGAEAEPTYSRLLGTGGNFGRQDLSVTYLNRALSVLGDPRSRVWLSAALTGDETVPYLRDAVGQFDPAKAGGIQSSPWEKADDKGFVNPWMFLLTLEGALRRRAFPGAVPEMVTDQQPGVRGPRLTYTHGLVLTMADRDALVRGQLDSLRLSDLLAGLLCVQWPSLDKAGLPGGGTAASDPAVDLLLPFTTSGAEPLFVRPGSTWPALLAAGRVQDVLDDARHRLRVGGCSFVVTPVASCLDPQLIAASLLLPSDPAQRGAALDRTTRTEEENTE